jgi:hypothetical protein
LSHPFLTDLQRLSWRTTAGNTNSYFYFRRPNADKAALYIKRSYSDIGGVARIGPPLGRLALVGGSISVDELAAGLEQFLHGIALVQPLFPELAIVPGVLADGEGEAASIESRKVW